MTFFHIFHFHQVFLWLCGATFLKFSENQNKENNVMGSIFCYAQELRRFLKSFAESPEQIISRATVTTSPELFNIFSLYFSIVYFSCSKPFTTHLSFVKNLEYYFKYVSFNKNKSLIDLAKINKKEIFWSGSFVEVCTCKETFLKWFAKIKKRLNYFMFTFIFTNFIVGSFAIIKNAVYIC